MPARTDRLDFAAFLVGGHKLRFLRCEPLNGSRLCFVFDAPQDELDEWQAAFDAGAEAPAAAVFDSLRHLRKLMTRTQSKGAIE